MPTPKKDLAPIDSALQLEVTEWASKLSDEQREEFASKFPCPNVSKRCVGDALGHMELLRYRRGRLISRAYHTSTADTTDLLRETRLAANYLVRDCRVAEMKECIDEHVANEGEFEALRIKHKQEKL